MAERWVRGRGYLPVPDKVERFAAAYARLCQRYGLCFEVDRDNDSYHDTLVIVPLDGDALAHANDAQVDPRVAAGLIED